MTTLVFYYSRQSLEQMYHALIGTTTERQKVKGEKNAAKFSLGLAKLLENIIGLAPKVDIAGEENFSETIKYVENVSDRVVELIEKSKSFSFPNVKDIKDGDNEIFGFELNVKVTEIYQSKKLGNLVRITYDSDHLHIEGFTSKENWTSLSMLNTILHYSEFETNLDQMKGYLTPLKITIEKDKTFVKAQFLILYR